MAKLFATSLRRYAKIVRLAAIKLSSVPFGWIARSFPIGRWHCNPRCLLIECGEPRTEQPEGSVGKPGVVSTYFGFCRSYFAPGVHSEESRCLKPQARSSWLFSRLRLALDWFSERQTRMEHQQPGATLAADCLRRCVSLPTTLVGVAEPGVPRRRERENPCD